MNQSDPYAKGLQSGYAVNGSPSATQSPTTANMYASQMSPYSYYGQQTDQVYSSMGLVSNPSNYYFNPWSYAQTSSLPLFNPGQPPPPLPAEVMKPPPPPPESGFKAGRGRYRSVYPRGNTVRGGMKRPRFQPGTYSKNNSGLSTHQSEPDVYDSDQSENNIQVHKKSKRRPMSARYTRRRREWCHDDAVKALALEEEYHRQSRAPTLILRFPDPEISNHIVRTYSPDIESVHFQQPSTARYCFVQLKVGADVNEVREKISQIEFGTGKITAEHKMQNYENRMNNEIRRRLNSLVFHDSRSSSCRQGTALNNGIARLQNFLDVRRSFNTDNRTRNAYGFAVRAKRIVADGGEAEYLIEWGGYA